MTPVLANWVAVGRMTKEEAARSSRRHSLRSAVMGDEIHLIDVSSQSVGIRQDDRLLLASDGLMTLEDEEIACIIENNPDAPLEEIAAVLIQAVEEPDIPARTIRRCCSTSQKPILGRECFPRNLENQSQKQAYQDSGLDLRKCSQNLQVRLDLLRVEIIL